MLRRGLILAAALALTASVAAGLVAAKTQDPIGEAIAKAPPPPPGEEPPPPSKETQIVVPPATPAPETPQPKVAVEPIPPKSAETKAPLTKRTRYPAAIVQTLDKVTAESMRFEVRIGQPKRYKNLIFTVRSCEVTAPDEAARDAVAYMEIDSQPKPVDGRAPPAAKQVFRGWLFAASPSVNPVQHPVYDAWLIACKA